MSLVQQFSLYTGWRSSLGANLEQLRSWLHGNDLLDAGGEARLAHLRERLSTDRLNVAFVAEFSRGKSELINAIFFAEYRARILPSSAGRTTMCPTELLFDPRRPPAIELLPIETRAARASISEYRRYPEEWRRFPLDMASVEAMQETLGKIGQQKRVSREEAARLGFAIDPTGRAGLRPSADGTLEIPSWRHAVINFPHPLLEQGLVVLDTPGLNAIGAEPELTLSLLPNAHAILFVLAADTGVTQTDLEVWRDHVAGSGAHAAGRIAVLNKIDGLWDGLRSDIQIDAEVERQVASCARILDLDPGRVFPVSAQKGLVAKVTGDQELLARARLSPLEAALAEELLPAKRQIVAENVRREAGEIIRRTRELLGSRRDHVVEQRTELVELRGKNRGVVEYMMRKIRLEKEEFESGMRQYYAVRSVFSSLSNKIFLHLGAEPLRDEVRRTREAMLASSFSLRLRGEMTGFFQRVRAKLMASADDIHEISQMLQSMYRRFAVEHGLKLADPASFSLQPFADALDRLEYAFDRHINTLFTIFTMEKRALTEKFFETVAEQARAIYESASREVEAWLRGVMAPLETQVREHQQQLKRRLDSVKRITQATETLQDRITELAALETQIERQIAELDAIERRLTGALAPERVAVAA
jgi:hypothetical protein